MNDELELKRRQAMTFEEAEGLIPPPAQFKDGELTTSFRNQIWTIMYGTFKKNEYVSAANNRYWVASPLSGMLFRELLERRHVPVDEIKVRFASRASLNLFIQKYKAYILTAHSKMVIGFLQWIVRDSECPSDLLTELKSLFARVPQGYSLVGDPPTFIPSVSEEESAALETALADIGRSAFTGAKSHLARASQALSDGDSRGAIRESIHAVESAASQIARQKSTLADALKLLGKDKTLHPALQQAFVKLYGYTSDEQGLRHA